MVIMATLTGSPERDRSELTGREIGGVTQNECRRAYTQALTTARSDDSPVWVWADQEPDTPVTPPYPEVTPPAQRIGNGVTLIADLHGEKPLGAKEPFPLPPPQAMASHVPVDRPMRYVAKPSVALTNRPVPYAVASDEADAPPPDACHFWLNTVHVAPKAVP